jgi:heme exporter protein B
MFNHPILFLIKLEWICEKKNKFLLLSTLLYTVTVVFICYQSFKLKLVTLNSSLWSALFWIIIVFSVINAVSRTFDFIKESKFLYYYQLTNPQHLFLAKILYNSLILFLINIFTYLVYSIVMGGHGLNFFSFLFILFLGSFGLASTITTVVGIASKTHNSLTLVSILALPLLLPQLLNLIKLTKLLIDQIPLAHLRNDIFSLSSINIISSSLGYILFPYLWRT